MLGRAVCPPQTPPEDIFEQMNEASRGDLGVFA